MPTDIERRGLSLLEMVVAMALTLAVLLIALAMLDICAARILRAELAGDAVQRARIAQDTIAHDLRLPVSASIPTARRTARTRRSKEPGRARS
jgi:Tfp pilus assembly protein PilW